MRKWLIRPVSPKDIDPAHGRNDKADPEREHSEKQEDCFVSGSAFGSILSEIRNVAITCICYLIL
jgi:hypothetical protein